MRATFDEHRNLISPNRLAAAAVAVALIALSTLLSACSRDALGGYFCLREGEFLKVDRLTCAQIDGVWTFSRGGSDLEPRPEAAPTIPVESEPL